MKNLLAYALLIIFSIGTLSAELQFEKIKTPHDSPIFDIAEAPNGDLWAASYGIFRSTDKGQTWIDCSEIEHEGQKYNLKQILIQIRNINITKNGVILVGLGDVLLRSDDQGKSWNMITEIESVKHIEVAGDKVIISCSKHVFFSDHDALEWKEFEGIDLENSSGNVFFDEDNGMWLGSKEQIFYMSAESSSFSTVFEGNPDTDSVRYFNRIFGNKSQLFATAYNTQIYSSTDMGKTWNLIQNELTDSDIIFIQKDNNNNFYAGISDGQFSSKILFSENNGNTWSDYNTPDCKLIHNIKFYKDKKYIASTSILQSNINEDKWEIIPNSPGSQFIFSYSANLSGNSTIITYSDIYFAYKNKDNFEKIKYNFDPKRILTHFIDNDNNIYIFYNDEGLLRTSDKGETWNTVYDSIQTCYSYDIDDPGNITILAEFSDKSMRTVKSTDNGNSWNNISVMNIYFSDYLMNKNIIYSEDPESSPESETALLSVDYGKTTVKIKSVSKMINEYDDLNDIIVSDDLILISTESTGILRSTDFGQSWAVITDGIPLSMQYVDKLTETGELYFWDNIAYCGTESGLYSSTDEGLTWMPSNADISPSQITDIRKAPDGYLYISTFDGLFKSTEQLVSVDDNKNIPNNNISVTISPNPANERIILSLNSEYAANYKIAIYDLNGQNIKASLIKHINPGENQIDIPCAGMPSGTYIIKAESDHNSVSTKFVISK